MRLKIHIHCFTHILRSLITRKIIIIVKKTYFKVWGSTRVRIRRYSGDKETLQNRELEVMDGIESFPQTKSF